MKCFSLNMGPDHEFEGLSLPFHEPPTSQHPSLCVSGMDMKEVDPPLSYPGGSFTEERCLGQKMGKCGLEINSKNSPKCDRLYPVVVYQVQTPGQSQNCT